MNKKVSLEEVNTELKHKIFDSLNQIFLKKKKRKTIPLNLLEIWSDTHKHQRFFWKDFKQLLRIERVVHKKSKTVTPDISFFLSHQEFIKFNNV